MTCIDNELHRTRIGSIGSFIITAISLEIEKNFIGFEKINHKRILEKHLEMKVVMVALDHSGERQWHLRDFLHDVEPK